MNSIRLRGVIAADQRNESGEILVTIGALESFPGQPLVFVNGKASKGFL
jgi:hypothetical protein